MKNEIKITKELLEKAEKCTTADELIALAKESGIELSAEDAEEFMQNITSKKPLTDGELDQIAGGSFPYCGRNVENTK